MRVGKWDFKPRLVTTAIMLAVLFVLIRLGIWQLHRANYKRSLIAEFHLAVQKPPIPLKPLSEMALSRFQHVEANGSYDGRHQVLLQEIQHAGRVGFDVLTPFRLSSSGMMVLVNRGWVPASQTGKPLANLTVDNTQRTIRGMLSNLPVAGIKLGEQHAGKGWPKQLLFPDFNFLGSLYHGPVLRRVLLLDADETDGFVRVWQPDIGFPPVRHTAYAFQWFALGITLVIIWVVVNSRRINSNDGMQDDRQQNG